ncbi:hypothetical protein GCM10022631_12720 [Deinococcus rubellus]|uniref:Uncharacterized protein n=1 Tax=Deinococcus rubellus TaxID=1889240 RepID=A0ABY5YF11_9DEIO|nr:hypothetical protein [Deinococcus rubellus]UWX63301.1 hypothetical protein N0D28_11145 [Deinococcus rubellus]
MDVLGSLGLVLLSVGGTLGFCEHVQTGYRSRPYLIPTWLLMCCLGWLLMLMYLLRP